MRELPALAIALSIGSVGPILMWSARVLVPARIAWRHCAAAWAVLALGPIPALLGVAIGSPGTIPWLICAGMVFPFVAGAYLRQRARTPDGRALGFRRAGELSLWTLCIAQTAGIAVWAATMVR